MFILGHSPLTTRLQITTITTHHQLSYHITTHQYQLSDHYSPLTTRLQITTITTHHQLSYHITTHQYQLSDHYSPLTTSLQITTITTHHQLSHHIIHHYALQTVNRTDQENLGPSPAVCRNGLSTGSKGSV